MAEKGDSNDVQSPIIMKVDGPPDENDVEEPSHEPNDNEMNTNIENSTNNCTNSVTKIPILAKPKFGTGNAFSLRSSVLSSPKLAFGGSSSSSSKSSILRPSQLHAQTTSERTSKSESVANSSINPFLKSDNIDLEIGDDEKRKENSVENNKEPGPSIAAPRFVPLENKSSPANSTTGNFSSTSAPAFVFGQNLHERAIAEQDVPTSSFSANATASTNGTSESLFSSAAIPSRSDAGSTSETKSLSEAAREYEESRAQKRKYDEVVVVTGEEGENNVLQISCKLFAFDQVTRNWQERGRGTLRLNDSFSKDDDTHKTSRLVVRAAGSLRVVLNTKIWAGMSVQQASPKSVRLTAMDSSGIVKVFLIMANTTEIEKLYKYLKQRVDLEISRQNQNSEKDTATSDTEPSPKKVAIEESKTEEANV